MGQRIDLVDATNQLRQRQPDVYGELVVVLEVRCLSDASSQRGLALLDPHGCMCREAAVAPGRNFVVSASVTNSLPRSTRSTSTRKNHVLGVDPGKRVEYVVRHETAVRHDHVDTRIEIEQLFRGLQEPGRTRSLVGTVKVGVGV